MAEQRRWIGEVPSEDDFGVPITDEFIDGATRPSGMWGFMTPESWNNHGVGRLGPGLGQRYKLTDGVWLKVEG